MSIRDSKNMIIQLNIPMDIIKSSPFIVNLLAPYSASHIWIIQSTFYRNRRIQRTIYILSDNRA